MDIATIVLILVLSGSMYLYTRGMNCGEEKNIQDRQGYDTKNAEEKHLREWMAWEMRRNSNFFFLSVLLVFVAVFVLYLPFGWVIPVLLEVIYGYRFVWWRHTQQGELDSLRMYDGFG